MNIFTAFVSSADGAGATGKMGIMNLFSGVQSPLNMTLLEQFVAKKHLLHCKMKSKEQQIYVSLCAIVWRNRKEWMEMKTYLSSS